MPNFNTVQVRKATPGATSYWDQSNDTIYNGLKDKIYRRGGFFGSGDWEIDPEVMAKLERLGPDYVKQAKKAFIGKNLYQGQAFSNSKLNLNGFLDREAAAIGDGDWRKNVELSWAAANPDDPNALDIFHRYRVDRAAVRPDGTIDPKELADPDKVDPSQQQLGSVQANAATGNVVDGTAPYTSRVKEAAPYINGLWNDRSHAIRDATFKRAENYYRQGNPEQVAMEQKSIADQNNAIQSQVSNAQRSAAFRGISNASGINAETERMARFQGARTLGDMMNKIEANRHAKFADHETDQTNKENEFNKWKAPLLDAQTRNDPKLYTAIQEGILKLDQLDMEHTKDALGLKLDLTRLPTLLRESKLEDAIVRAAEDNFKHPENVRRRRDAPYEQSRIEATNRGLGVVLPIADRIIQGAGILLDHNGRTSPMPNPLDKSTGAMDLGQMSAANPGFDGMGDYSSANIGGFSTSNYRPSGFSTAARPTTGVAAGYVPGSNQNAPALTPTVRPPARQPVMGSQLGRMRPSTPKYYG